MRLTLRTLALGLAALSVAASLALLPAPVSAATKNAGLPDITPYGSYLGNYLAPDGTRVYCIDSPLPWPSGPTSGPAEVAGLVTTWGAVLPASSVRQLNFVLLKYGQTDDAVQAAAVAAFVNAFTSGWARDWGAGYEAGAWYLNGNATVIAVYDTIWADARANADPQGSATATITMTDATTGELTLSATPSSATGTVSLSGAVRAETGESSFAVGSDEHIALRGTPSDDSRSYAVTAEASYTAEIPAAASVLMYTTPDQQRTIRGSSPGALSFAASAGSEAIPLDFVPVLSTSVASASPAVGEALVDVVTVGVADGSRPWRWRAEGTPVPLVAHGVVYGPLAEAPEPSDAVPAGTPVAGREVLTIDGPGEYRSAGNVVVTAPGYYTWVWTISASAQDATGAAALPEGFELITRFGLPEETHRAVPLPHRLAATGSTTLDAAAWGVGFIAVGTLLGVGRGISSTRRRWALRD